MDTLASLDGSITRWNLLEHPFYRAWSDGTLPIEKLQRYAGEYGSFIKTIAQNWRGAGEQEIAAEEDTHFTMWQDFSRSIGGQAVAASLPETQVLVSLSASASADRAMALGSLYAFEAQQPRTAVSKLDGLRQHYAHVAADDTYFRVHMNDDVEPALLRSEIANLSPADQSRASDACEETCAALWNALSAIEQAS
jgi:pyrroloquinoline-quinone synthase